MAYTWLNTPVWYTTFFYPGRDGVAIDWFHTHSNPSASDKKHAPFTSFSPYQSENLSSTLEDTKSPYVLSGPDVHLLLLEKLIKMYYTALS
jgi:hypothetical protein